MIHWLFVPAKRCGSLHWNKPCGEAHDSHDLVFQCFSYTSYLSPPVISSLFTNEIGLAKKIAVRIQECGRVDGWSSWDGCNIGVPAVWISSITTLWSLVSFPRLICIKEPESQTSQAPTWIHSITKLSTVFDRAPMIGKFRQNARRAFQNCHLLHFSHRQTLNCSKC